MLGSRVASELSKQEIKFSQISRVSYGGRNLGNSYGEDLEIMKTLEKTFGKPTHIINAVGVVKPRIDETKSDSVLNAIQVNSQFPRNIGSYCEANGSKVDILIKTYMTQPTFMGKLILWASFQVNG